ncbi:MAG: BamA/TamA family outer membrane protein [bacterium]
MKTRPMRFLLFLIGSIWVYSFNTPNVDAFGKNKVTYSRFDWKVHSTEHFEFYYYMDETESMLEIIRYFETAYTRISSDLGTDLSGKIPVILYRTYSDFQQTNVLSGFIPSGVGGFSELLKRRIVIPLQNSKKDLESLINHELVHSFQFEVFFQNRISRISEVPLWVMEGMAEHLSADWDAVGRMVLRDAVINGCVPELEKLNTFDYLPNPYMGYKISQSAIDFLRKEYGMDKFRSLIWEVRKTLRSREYMQNAVKEIYGMTLGELSAKWQNDLRRRIIEIERRRESVVEFKKSVMPSEEYSRRFSPVFGLGGEVIHYVELDQDGFNIFTSAVKDPEKKQIDLCLTCNLNKRKYRGMVTEGRALSSCLSDGRLAYINKYENRHDIQILDPAVKGLTGSVLIPEDSPTSPAFSPDGRFVAYAAWVGMQSDIFIMDLETGKTRNLTNDQHVDRTPYWSPDGSWIVYSSERQGQFDLMLIDVHTGQFRPLISDQGDQITPAWSPDGKKIVYISDQIDGVLDPYILDIETMESHRLAAPVTGCMTPSFSVNSRDIVLTFYAQGTEKIIVISADRRPVIPSVAVDAEELGADGEAYFSSLKDASPKTVLPKSKDDLENADVKFRLIPDYAVGMVAYGTSGDFYLEGGVVLSDILGDHRIEVIGSRRDNQGGLMAKYMYLRQRIDYGAAFVQGSDYYYVFNMQKREYQRVSWNEYLALYYMEYPFSTYYRADLSVGYRHFDYETSVSGFGNFKRQYAYIEPALSGDTVEYKFMAGYPEIYRGWRFRISAQIPLEMEDSFESYWNTQYDFREYIPVGKRTVLAFRQWGAVSRGRDSLYYGIGGPGTIRGYGYKQIVGNNVVVANAEFRFPILDHLIFPGNIGFHGFRGKFFVDAGMALIDSESVTWKFDNPRTPIHEGSWNASYGWGINFWLIGVEWHFEWAKKTNFNKTSGDWSYEWSIRRSF